MALLSPLLKESCAQGAPHQMKPRVSDPLPTRSSYTQGSPLYQGYVKVAFRCLSSRLRRSPRGIVEVVAGFQPATTSTMPLNVGPLADRHEQKDDFCIALISSLTHIRYIMPLSGCGGGQW